MGPSEKRRECIAYLKVSAALPDVPTVAETVPEFEFTASAAIVDTLNREVNAALADPQMKARFAELSARN